MDAVEEYDIMHVEDDERTVKGAEERAIKLGLRYCSYRTLAVFREALQKPCRALLYVLDGKFPDVHRGLIKFRADEAVELIRKVVGDNARIILVSNDGDIESRAAILSVDFFSKDSVETDAGIVDKLHEMLSGFQD